MTDQEKADAIRAHITSDHKEDPLSNDLAALVYSWHPAIHEFEDAAKKFHAVRHTIQVITHTTTTSED